MNSEIPDNFKTVIKSAAKKLSGSKRREYIAEITNEFLEGNARKAERVFGWGRETVKKAIRELDTGIICLDNYSARGNKKTEEKMPGLVEDIQSIVEGNSSSRKSTTAKAVRQSLILMKGYRDEQLPTEMTIENILTRSAPSVMQTIMFDELPVRCRKQHRKWLKKQHGDPGPEDYAILASKEPKGKNGRRIWSLTFMSAEEFESSETLQENSDGKYYKVIDY